MTYRKLSTPEERAEKRAAEYIGMLWHIATYIVIIGFLWFVDQLNGGLEFVYWVAAAWGIGLAFHIAAYFFETSRITDRKYEQFLEAERKRESDKIGV